MDYQRPDSDGETPQDGARVEQDFIRPLRPMRVVSHRRLPAALPFAIAGILVVSSVAFGATVIHNFTTPPPDASAVVVGDDNPTDAPTLAPTESQPQTSQEPETSKAPETPVVTAAPGELSLTAETLPGKVKLTWSAYTGEGFAYYKVVRSSDATATWPLGDGDSLIAAIDNKTTVTYTDACGAGTYTFRVFAVKSSSDGYTILTASPARTVTVAPATTNPPAPVSNPSDLGPLHVTDNGGGSYTFSWAAYTGDIDFSYYKLDGQPYPNTPGYVENGGHYWAYVDKNTTSTTICVQPGTWNVVVEAVYYPNGAASAGKTSVIKMVVAPRPTATIQTLSLSADRQSDGVQLSWSAYTPSNFEYYKVVRSESSSEPTWPCPGLTDIQYRPNRPRKDVHHGGHGTAETTETVVPKRVQG